MDKKLNELKDQFKKDIPTSFTAQDRRAIRNRIKQPETKRDYRHFFPKAITGLVFATLLFVGVMIANDQIKFITDGDMPAPAQQNSDQLTAEPQVKEEPLLMHFTKNREYDSLTFDPKSIRPGDVVGEDTTDAMKMVDRTSVDGKAVFTFVGVMELTGDLYKRAGELQFIPNMESIQQLPVAREDLGDLVKAGVLNEDVVRKIFGIGPSFESSAEVSIVIERVEYRYSEEGTSIYFGVRKAVSAEDEMDEVLPHPEYNSFQKFVESTAAEFNGTGDLREETNMSSDTFHMHMFYVAKGYLEHFRATGEVPDNVKKIVNETISIAKEGSHYKNQDKHEQYYKKLQKKFSKLNKIINTK